jgi:phosphatidylcholine synthase
VNPSASSADPVKRALSWGVHLFTASGAVFAVVALIAIVHADYRIAAFLMLVGLFIDSVDGTLARRVGVTEHVPHIDGRRLDDLVDFLNYAIVPTVFLLAIGALPHWAWAAVPILASAYGFSQHEAKTEDDFFLGWPSYWNVLALYVWMLDVSMPVATALVVGCAIAVFVPLKYVYPSKLRVWRGGTALATLVWGTTMAAAVLWPERARALRLVEISLLFPAYYLGLSAWLGGWLRRGV